MSNAAFIDFVSVVGESAFIDGRKVGWQFRPFAVGNPKVQFVPVRIAEYECWPSPLIAHRVDAALPDVA